MDLGRVIEGGGGGERASTMAGPHDVSIRDTAHPSGAGNRDLVHPPAFRTLEGSRPSILPSIASNAQQSHLPSDVWAGALSRMQTQISYNTSMLESHRRQVGEIEQAVGRLHTDLGNVIVALNEVRGELRARPVNVEPARHDSGDLEVLAGQMATVTNKANEVDGLKMQIELMKNRIKRFEDQGSPSAPSHRPGTSSTHRELYELTPAPHAHPMPQQPLPPMRTAAGMSPPHERPHGMHAPPVLLSQGSAIYNPHSGSRMLSSEQSSFGAVAPGFRPVEPLPPPSSFSGWRSAESHPPSSGVPPPPQLSQPFHPQPMAPETQSSGWAAVNVSQSAKRPFEEQRASVYESSSAPGSPKRPKLAPIMPRGSYGDESFVPTPSSMQQTATTATPDSRFDPRSRAPSDPSQTQYQGLPTPASANTSSYRFITSTAQADSQESWRPEDQRMPHPQPPPGPPGRGRGKGRGGRGRGRAGRGGAHQYHGQPPPPDHHHAQHHGPEELGTPDWEKSGWTGSQISPDGYYNPMHHQRGSLVRRSGGAAGGPSEREQEHPATPIQGEQDPFGMQIDSGENSANKKSRTKPIRNAEGVLIRKDGRPDMRSVSSANNLRKVHAKKEAERAEMEGRTPTSGRSIAPAHSNSLSEDGHPGTRSGTPVSASAADGDELDTQERHQELVSKLFPHGIEGTGRRNLAGDYFPRREEHPTSIPETVMKTEEPDDENEQQRIGGGGEDSQVTDTVMREVSEAQAEEHASEQQRPRSPQAEQYAAEQRHQQHPQDANMAPRQEHGSNLASEVPPTHEQTEAPPQPGA